MSKCMFCKIQTPDGIIKCNNCVKEKKTINFVLAGNGWAACESSERKQRYNKLVNGI